MTAIDHPINAAGHLTIGGADAVELAAQFQTPLIVYDVADIRRRAAAFCRAFEAEGVSYQVAYASKALSVVAMYQIMQQEGLYVDVVSGGELYTALHAGVPASRIHFHGNNKSDEEMRYALRVGVGCMVVDSMREVQRLPVLAAEVFGAAMPHGVVNDGRPSAHADTNTSPGDAATQSRLDHQHHHHCHPSTGATADARGVVNVLLRVAPGITAHTHAHNTTGQVDSKFGFDMESGQATLAFHTLAAHPHVRVLGVHCHIGSQIFNAAGHAAAARRLVALMDGWGMRDGCVLNVGGGYGVRYTSDDDPISLEGFVHAIVSAVRDYVRESEASATLSPSSASPSSDAEGKEESRRKTPMTMPSFWIEPGRSLVSEAGTTLYTVGAHKTVPHVRTYLAVDGGMSDNIRPVTYQALYSAALANKMHAPADCVYTVVGKLCESGDQLIRDARLAEAQDGDVLAVFCTGAYCYSMASNYNKLCRPAIVFVEGGVAKLVVQRELPEDLIRRELSYT